MHCAVQKWSMGMITHAAAAYIKWDKVTIVPMQYVALALYNAHNPTKLLGIIPKVFQVPKMKYHMSICTQKDCGSY